MSKHRVFLSRSIEEKKTPQRGDTRITIRGGHSRQYPRRILLLMKQGAISHQARFTQPDEKPLFLLLDTIDRTELLR